MSSPVMSSPVTSSAAPGSVAVVTGGGRGLGRGIALALAEAGFDVVIGYAADKESAITAADAVRAAGQRAETVAGDVTDAAAAADLLEAATALGPLGAWVNNAGVSALAPLVDADVADLERMLGVNVVGVLHGVQAAARRFADGDAGGRIVNIASDLGVRAFPYLGAYAASKFAVVGLTQAAALELAPSGITVNAVCPGTAETDMVAAERSTEAELTRSSLAAVRAGYLEAIPVGRFCTPEDVGSAVAWLCSPGAAYVTGQAICVNGGSVLH